MIKIYFFICISFINFLLQTCISIEFVADSSSNYYYNFQNKKNWNEIEITKERPEKPTQLMGELVIRNFNQGALKKYYLKKIKKILFKNHLDGVWIQSKGIQIVQPFMIQTGDSNGMVVSTVGTLDKMELIRGKGFIYLKN